MLLLELLLPGSLLLQPNIALLGHPQGHYAALLSDLRCLHTLPVGFLYHIHVHHAHLDDMGHFMLRHDRLALLRDHTTAIFGADRDVFVHQLIFLVKKALFIILDVVCLQKEMELFLLNLL